MDRDVVRLYTMLFDIGLLLTCYNSQIKWQLTTEKSALTVNFEFMYINVYVYFSFFGKCRSGYTFIYLPGFTSVDYVILSNMKRHSKQPTYQFFVLSVMYHYFFILKYTYRQWEIWITGIFKFTRQLQGKIFYNCSLTQFKYLHQTFLHSAQRVMIKCEISSVKRCYTLIQPGPYRSIRMQIQHSPCPLTSNTKSLDLVLCT